MARKILDRNTTYVIRHLHFGWWALLLFLTLGIVLEALHGFKVDLYVHVANKTRRTMWILAHTHGTLTSLINIVFAVTLRVLPTESTNMQRFASPCLIGATICLPGGFFLGGLVFYAGDPGLGILLVPIGAALLFISVLVTGLAMRSQGLSVADLIESDPKKHPPDQPGDKKPKKRKKK